MRALEEFKPEWWWFDKANKQHIHELSAAWEILRRTESYRLLFDRMRAACSAAADPEERSVIGVLRKARLVSQLQALLPRTPPAPPELRQMAGHWQTMIVNGWTPDRTYLAAAETSKAECVLSDSKRIRIPPIAGILNRGIPVILPRQVEPSGQTFLFAELCNITPRQPPQFAHVAGVTAPSDALRAMQRYRKPIPCDLHGLHLAFLFHLQRPAKALRKLVKPELDRIERSDAWEKPTDSAGNSRGPSLVIGTTNALHVIALFSAKQPRNVIERGFCTMTRPDRIARVLPQLREEWIKWEAAEQGKYARDPARGKVLEKAQAAWDEAIRNDRLAAQSTVHPVMPAEALDNVACSDCAPFYKRNRAKLPISLPERLRTDPNLNKSIAHGLGLICSVDEVFLPLLAATR